jgi:hypothetical protein
MPAFHPGIPAGLSAVILFPCAAAAQGTLAVTPSLSATQVYESNLFSTSSDRQADSITRVTPGIQSEYRSPLWTLSGRYSLDAERFADHRELTAAAARQTGAVAVVYRAETRTTLTGGAEYLATRTPSELYETTGLSFTRARASRVAAHSSLVRHLDSISDGTLEYRFTEDRLSGGFEAQTHTIDAGVSRRLSARTAVVTSYRVERYGFATPAGRSTVMSYALGAGVTHAVTRGLNVSLEGGPRLTDGVILPDLSLVVGWTPDPFVLSFRYGRTQSTAIGAAGPLDAERLHASIAAAIGRSTEIRFSPGAFRTSHAGRRADVLVLAAGVTHKFGDHLALEVGFDGALQEGTVFSALTDTTIPRHTAWMRIVAAPRDRDR